jgi:hypothetical protein
MPTTYRFEVYQKNIAALFLPSGDAGRWIHKIADEMEDAVNASTPTRSGALRTHNRSERVAVGGAFFGNQYVAAYEVTNDSPYFSYVHDGTRSQRGVRALPPGGPGLNTVSRYAGQHFGKKVMRKGVRGQKENPWLRDACVMVAMRYGAVPYMA